MHDGLAVAPVERRADRPDRVVADGQEDERAPREDVLRHVRHRRLRTARGERLADAAGCGCSPRPPAGPARVNAAANVLRDLAGADEADAQRGQRAGGRAVGAAHGRVSRVQAIQSAQERGPLEQAVAAALAARGGGAHRAGLRFVGERDLGPREAGDRVVDRLGRRHLQRTAAGERRPGSGTPARASTCG
jgi:hypothetical protein